MSTNGVGRISISQHAQAFTVEPTDDEFQTLATFIMSTAKDEDSSDLSILIQSIATSCKYIQNCVRKMGLAKLGGEANTGQNVQGETQMKLDVVANDVFVGMLDTCKRCTVLVSEEIEDPVYCKPSNAGRYVCVFDPLDGSSNVDCGVSVGSIFGIYRATEKGVARAEDALQPGKCMVAAGYCMYGSYCNFVLTIGGHVHGFTLDPSLGEFILTHPKITVPKRGSIYSVNEGNTQFWDEGMKTYVERCKNQAEPRGARYIGSMVADIHRTLLYGGTFSYPSDRKHPDGKLRLLYECFPMAMIVEKAGGKASDGCGRILDIKPTSIHQRQGIHLGSVEDVDEIEECMKNARRASWDQGSRG